jgi:hypothetical protein
MGRTSNFIFMGYVSKVRLGLLSKRTALWTFQLVFVHCDKNNSGNEPEQQQDECNQKGIDTCGEPPVHITIKPAGMAFSE